VVELYLPKRIEYQAALYQALEEALTDPRSTNSVVKTWLYKHKRDPQVKRCLPPEIRAKYDSAVRTFRNYLYGYSMYEVDGAFRVPRAGRRSDIAQERTQVVRLISRQPPTAVRYRSLVRDFLISRDYAETFKATRNLRGYERTVIDRMDKFFTDWALLLYGYLIPRIAAAKRITEQQIWITSYSVVTNIFTGEIVERGGA